MTTSELVNRAWNAGLKGPPILSVSEWADAHRYVVAPSPEPGQWRTDRTPYLRGIMDCLSPMEAARTIAVMKGSQLGASEAALNWLGYKIHQYPSSFMIILPTQKVAEEWSKTRLDLMVEHSPVMAGLIQKQKSRDSGNTIFNKKVAGGRGLIKFAWASAAATLRSTPAGDLILDEVDAFKADVDEEGDPVTNLKRRFTNFPRGKMLMISTPTGASASRINREFKAGDQRLYFMPCPFCQHYQHFVFRGRLVWPKAEGIETIEERDARHARVAFRCIGCAELIPERYKGQMLAGGEWVATAHREDLPENGFAVADLPAMEPIFTEMKRARWVSFHIPAGLSPLGWFSWSTMAADWEASHVKRDVNALKVFVNQILGEVWDDERGEAPDDEKIWLKREEYPAFSVGEGELPWDEFARVPKRGLFLTAGVDVQQSPARLEVGVKAWGRDKEAWHLGYWVFEGDVSRADNKPWKLLAELLAKDFPHECGENMAITAMAIDTGYLAGTVYDFALRHPRPAHNDATGSRIVALRTVVPTAGAEDWQKVVSSVSKTDASQRRQGVRIWKVGGQRVKSELFGWLNMEKPEEGIASPGYQHYPDYHRAWFNGLCSEEKVVKGGRVFYQIIPGHERNEPLDTEQYNRLAASVRGIDGAYPDGRPKIDWADLERQLKMDAPPATVVPADMPTMPGPVVQQAQQQAPQARRVFARFR